MFELLLLVALALLVAPVVSLVLSLGLQGRVRRLEARLEALEADRRAAGAAPPVAREAAEAPAPAPPPAAPPAPAPVAVSAPAPSPVVPRPRPRAPAEPLPVRPPPQPARRGASLSQIEGLLGERWLNRAGALVLVLGIGFFLKYAFDNQWIGPTGRIAIGLLVGIAFLTAGERLQRAAYRVPAQGLAAAGIATLYLSVYAAYGFYRLVPQPAAFALMVLVTAAAMAVAIRHDARAIAILASVGGFLTPVLLSTGQDAAIPLFTYLAVLDAGILASAYWRRWPELPLLSFAFTHALYWAWFDEWYRPEKLAVALVAASVFFGLFALAGPVEAARGRLGPRLDVLSGGTALVTLAAPTAYFLAARAILSPEYRTALGLLCLALAAFYVLLGQWTLRAIRDTGQVAVLYVALALAFLTLTFPVQFTEHTVTIAWSVEGVALLWGGFRLAAPKLRGSALAILALAGARWLTLLERPGWHEGRFLVDHPLLLATACFVAACALAAALYRTREAEAVPWEAAARPVLVLAAFGSGALFVSAEIFAYRPLAYWLPSAHRSVLVTLVWAVIAPPLLLLARGDRTRILLGATTALLAVVGLVSAGLAGDWRRVAPELRPAVVNLRFVAGLLIVALYGLYARLAPELPVAATTRARLRAAGGAAAALFLLWHLSAEIMLLPLGGTPRGEAAKIRNMGLSLLWTAYALAAIGAGIRWNVAPVRLGAIGLFAVTVAKVFLVDLAELDAVYRILSFLVLGGVLLLASFLYTRYRGRIGGGPP